MFTFFDDTNACWLQTTEAKLTMTAWDTGKGTVAGPKTCDPVPDRCGMSATASPGFPETMDTAWPENYQPRKLTCWETDRTGPTPALSTCGPTVVLQEVTKCTFRVTSPNEPSSILNSTLQLQNKTCKQVCEEKADCSTWEVADKAGVAWCYWGVGVGCAVVNATNGLTATGQRLGRGAVRDMFTWSNNEFWVEPVQTSDSLLEQQFQLLFDVSQYATLHQAADDCRQACVSLLSCEFWQLHSTAGCYIDMSDTSRGLAYPLTAKNFKLNATQIFAGGFLQHLCGVGKPAPAPAPGVTTTLLPSIPQSMPDVMAHVTLQLANLNYSAVTPDGLGKLSAAITRDLARFTSVPDSFVQSMAGVPGVTISPNAWPTPGAAPAARRLQAAGGACGVDGDSKVSTFVTANLLVPVGTTMEQIKNRIKGESKLVPTLENDAVTSVGAGSASILCSGVHLKSREVTAVPRPRLPSPLPAALPEVAASGGGLPWWAWVLIALGALLLCGAIAGCFLMGGGEDAQKKKKKSKSGRAKGDDLEAKGPYESEGAPLMEGSWRSDISAAPVTVAPAPLYTSIPQVAGQQVIIAPPARQVVMVAPQVSGSYVVAPQAYAPVVLR